MAITSTMQATLAASVNEWSKDAWLDKKRRLCDCVWITGAILRHTNEEMIYLAPSPHAFGILYEFRLEDVEEIICLDATKDFLDRSYKLARIYLKKKAVGTRISWLNAFDIVEEAKELADAAIDYENQVSSNALTDFRFSSLKEDPGSNVGDVDRGERSKGREGGAEKGGGNKGGSGGDKGGNRERGGGRREGASGVRG